MLYTTYFSQLDKLPKNAIKLVVTRYAPKDFNILKYEKLHVVSQLGPSKELLNKYNSTQKGYEDWMNFKEEFLKEIETREELQYNINKIINGLKRNIDVYLICYERNYNRCHRTILAEYICNKLKCDWKEF